MVWIIPKYSLHLSFRFMFFGANLIVDMFSWRKTGNILISSIKISDLSPKFSLMKLVIKSRPRQSRPSFFDTLIFPCFVYWTSKLPFLGSKSHAECQYVPRETFKNEALYSCKLWISKEACYLCSLPFKIEDWIKKVK